MSRGNNVSVTEEPTKNDSEKEKFEEGKEEPKWSFKEKCIYVIRNITVEPTMFLFILTIILIALTSQNLSLEIACRVNLNFTEEICDSLRLQTADPQNEYERDVQVLVTRAMAWKTYITATIPCLLALFIGSYSDKIGRRKIFINLSLFGQTLVCVNGIINTFFLHEVPLEVFIFAEATLEALSGSWCVCTLIVFAYISAITTEKERTFRMGLINFSLTVASPIGMGISGVLLRSTGYYGCYGISASLAIINLCYNTFILKDAERTDEHKQV